MNLSYLDSLMVELPANLAHLQADNLSSTNITTENIDVFGSLTIYGNVSALSGFTIVQSTVTNTSSLSVINEGIYPGLVVDQGISNPTIAIFKNQNGEIVVIDGNGIRTTFLSAHNAIIDNEITTTKISAVSLSADSLNVNNIIFSSNSNIINDTNITGDLFVSNDTTIQGPLSANTSLTTPSIILPNDGTGSINNDFKIFGNVDIIGSITVLSGVSAIDTFLTTTTALSVINTGLGPAFVVYNSPDTNPVAIFNGSDVDILTINNSEPAGKTGVIINQGLDIETGNVTLFDGLVSASGSTSQQWNNAYNVATQYVSISSDLLENVTLVQNNSAGWNNSLTAINEYEDTWNQASAVIQELSGNWNTAYNVATDFQNVSASFNIFYENSSLFLSGFNPVKFTFFGDGSANAFTLTANDVSKNPNNFRIDINGVLQEPDTDYVLSGFDIIFTTTPLLDEKIVIVASNTVGIFDVTPSSGSVTTDKLAFQSVTTDKLANDSVITNKIANESIVNEKLALTAVTTDKIFNEAVTTEKLALTAVTTDKIFDEAVTTEKIQNEAITEDKLALGSVTTEKLALSSITSETISVCAVLTENISDLAVTTEKINFQAITTERIADTAVTEDKANFTSVSQIELNPGGMSVGRVGQGVVDPIDNSFGVSLHNQGYIAVTRNNPVAYFNRLSSDGPIVNFYREGLPVGNIGVTGSGTSYNTTSDYRLKENITEFKDGLQIINQLQPRAYTWKNSQNTDTGFIAHELSNILPNLVTGEKDEVDKDGKIIPQTIDTNKLIPILVSAVQELAREVQKLKDK
jgi:hypothetical protein